MIGQGQDTTRIHTKKKGGPPPHGGPKGKSRGKKQRKKAEKKGKEGKEITREKQRWLGGVIGGHMSDSSCANIDVNIDLLVG